MELLMVSDAARIINRSAETIRNYERNGKLPAIKTPGGRRLFKRDDVERLAQELRGEAKDE